MYKLSKSTVLGVLEIWVTRPVFVSNHVPNFLATSAGVTVTVPARVLRVKK